MTSSVWSGEAPLAMVNLTRPASFCFAARAVFSEYVLNGLRSSCAWHATLQRMAAASVIAPRNVVTRVFMTSFLLFRRDDRYRANRAPPRQFRRCLPARALDAAP